MAARTEKLSPLTSPLFAGVSLNVTTTATFGVQGYNSITVFMNHSVNATATAIQLILEVQPEVDSTNWYRVTSNSIIAGASTRSALTDSYTVAAAAQWEVPWAIPPGSCRARLSVSSTAGGAGDLLTAYGVLATTVAA